jgi:hypothetical protein
VIIELIPHIGGQPIRLNISQFVVRQDNGTPISVGAEYGPDQSQAVSCVGNKDFERMLRILGIKDTVVVHTLQMPKPQPGARLIAGPTE